MPEIPNDVLEITNISQYTEIFNNYSENLIIITFYTNSCPVCAAFKPSFYAVQKEFEKQKVIFARLNSDSISAIAAQYNIMAVPTTIFFKGKAEIYRNTGMYPKPQFRSVINDVLKKFFNVKNGPSEQDMMYM